MTNITRINVGPRMSQAVVHAGIVYVAGQVSGKAAGEGVTAQTKDILDQIDTLLAKAGTDKTKLLFASVWLADIAGIGEMNAVWEAWLPQDSAPARATVEAKLAAPKFAVEISVTAAL